MARAKMRRFTTTTSGRGRGEAAKVGTEEQSG